MTNTSASLRGIIPSLVIPLQGGNIQWDGLERELNFLRGFPVNGLGLGGGLGELAGITPEEFGKICRFVRDRFSLPIFVTVLPDSEPEAYDLVQAAVESGADAVCLAQPHYLFQTSTTDFLLYFGRVRSRLKIPLLLANTSPTSIVPFSVISDLIGEALIDGLIQGGTDPHLLVDLLALAKRPPVFCAMEELAYTALLLGAEGISSTLASVFPGEMSALFAYVENGDHQAARSIHERLLRLWRTLDDPSEYFVRIRCALAAQGRDVGEAHAPFNILRPELAAEISRALAREGFDSHPGV